jgi:hypothetical protein
MVSADAEAVETRAEPDISRPMHNIDVNMCFFTLCYSLVICFFNGFSDCDAYPLLACRAGLGKH